MNVNDNDRKNKKRNSHIIAQRVKITKTAFSVLPQHIYTICVAFSKMANSAMSDDGLQLNNYVVMLCDRLPLSTSVPITCRVELSLY